MRSNRFQGYSLVLGVCAALAASCSDETTSSSSSGQGGEATEAAAWQTVFNDGDLDRALLSTWGSAEDDLYAVGGPLGNDGFEALVLHFDGASWKALSPGGTSSFWWVTGSGPTDLWMVGEKGRITHYDGQSFQEHTSGTTATLWGAVAFAPNDAWAVGGNVGGAEPDDVLLHFDGASWTPVTLPGTPLKRALFKVWGTSSNELFVVGELGVQWHKQGDTWTLESDPPLAEGNLTTVHGCAADDVWAVGGRDVLHYDGSAWSRQDILLTNDVNGVFCGPGGVMIVGGGGLKQHYDGASWQDDFLSEPHRDLHAVWGDPTGAFWAVGGDFISTPKPNKARVGTVARYGKGTVSTTLE